MKKYLMIVNCMFCLAQILSGQKNKNTLVIPNAHESVVITTHNLYKYRGNITKTNGDTLIVQTKKEGLIFLSLKNIKDIQTQTQAENNPSSVMLKIGGMLIPKMGLGVLDGGIEYKLNQHWTIQLSAAIRMIETEHQEAKKTIIVPQLRYYFLKNKWLHSPYLGILAQYHTENKSIGDGPINENTRFSKWGTGIMGGVHFKIGKSVGMDFHFGRILEKGNVIFSDYSSNPTKITSTNSWKTRNLSGLNLYFAF